MSNLPVEDLKKARLAAAAYAAYTAANAAYAAAHAAARATYNHAINKKEGV